MLAKSESIQARRFVPSFDQPGFKAPFQISLTIPQGYVAIGNTLEVSRTAVANGYEEVSFAPTPPMPSYLLSLAVGPFEVLEAPPVPPSKQRASAIPLRGVARPGRTEELRYILDITPRFIEIFEQALGQAYPFKKLDIVAAPEWASGATELSAAITYRESRVLLGKSPAPGARLSLLGLHAHELAHMWFGNLVTPPWWDDLWLKEGFATWATPMVLSEFEPEAGHDLDALLRNFAAMELDSLATTRAIREPIVRNEDIRNAYDSITYSKSQAIIHMVDSYFDGQRFRLALGNYISTFSDGVADSEDFYASIGKYSGEAAITQTLRQFVEQKGVPLLSIALHCPESGVNRLFFSQARYRPLRSQIGDASKWTVPVCVRLGGAAEQTACGLIDATDNVLELGGDSCPSWVMPNRDGAGYYRWTLPEPYWRALLDDFTVLSPAEQIAVLDSVIANYHAGDVGPETLLRVIALSSQSTVRQVVTMPMGSLRRLLLTVLEPESATALRGFLEPLYLSTLKRVEEPDGWEETLLHNRLLDFLARTLEHPATRGELVIQARRFIGDGELADPLALTSDLYRAALTAAVQDMGDAFIERLIQARSHIDDPRFELASAQALGAARDADGMERVRGYVFDSSLGSREAFNLVATMLFDPLSRQAHWDWFRSELDTIVHKVPDQWRLRLPQLADGFCRTEKIDELNALFDVHGQSAPGHELALRQTNERIRLCAALRTVQSTALRNWISNSH